MFYSGNNYAYDATIFDFINLPLVFWNLYFGGEFSLFFLKQSVIDYPVNEPLKLTIVPDE